LRGSFYLIISANLQCENSEIFHHNKLHVWKLRYFRAECAWLSALLRVQKATHTKKNTTLPCWIYSHLSTKTRAPITNHMCMHRDIFKSMTKRTETWKSVFFLPLAVNLRNIEIQTILSLITKVWGHVCIVQWHCRVYTKQGGGRQGGGQNDSKRVRVHSSCWTKISFVSIFCHNNGNPRMLSYFQQCASIFYFLMLRLQVYTFQESANHQLSKTWNRRDW